MLAIHKFTANRGEKGILGRGFSSFEPPVKTGGYKFGRRYAAENRDWGLTLSSSYFLTLLVPFAPNIICVLRPIPECQH